jgi:hypothetical protein
VIRNERRDAARLLYHLGLLKSTRKAINAPWLILAEDGLALRLEILGQREGLDRR